TPAAVIVGRQPVILATNGLDFGLHLLTAVATSGSRDRSWAYSRASSALTFSPIRSRTARNCSGGSAFGQGTFQSSRTLARRPGQPSPQPIVTATSNSP